MTVHLWNPKPSRASLCGLALFTHRITGNPYAVTCARCYLRYLKGVAPIPR